MQLIRCLLVLACWSVPGLTGAAELRVFVAGAARAAVEALAPDYERDSGDAVRASFDTVGALRDRVLAGERPDLVILSSAAVDALAQRGLVGRDERRDLGLVVAGLAVRRGAPVPDIASAEALKRTLLAAKSIAHADGSRGATSGAHFAKVVEALGLRESLAGRITVLPVGTDVVQGVADGRFEIGVSQSSEIAPNPGATFVAGLPVPFELRTTYVAAVVGTSEAGQRLLRFLGSEGARATLGAAGLSDR